MQKLKSTALPIICDTCGQPINSHQDAYVEWVDPNGVISNVHIVHNKPSSPQGDCFQHTNHFNRSDLELETILNPRHTDLKNELGLI
ncbi:hypothetical protein [Vibrio nigripulchritudo]|uniref:hypothetical protein n=1 Tax=Vibrio nigripulchritudo TaxID=28173 RepID=UPI002493B00E|nr:hypothetical protein [Vibrio nigripulchritudo]BDU37346.1 hypothetical protein TUMSATVNIG2_18150 [Vibrio nigripulchritudo]BDU43066.1 hypothetical protein TUMSATVNIG3_18640 [Vibrio nigripulchritudo]